MMLAQTSVRMGYALLLWKSVLSGWNMQLGWDTL